MEIWKDVKGYEGSYQVSNLGRVKSLDREIKSRYGFRKIKGIILKEIPDKDGYYRVNLKESQNGKTKNIHRLVATAFIDNKENKPQVNHINGVKNDNNVNNLEWSTLSENRQHAYNTGLQNSFTRRGAKNNFNKLTKSQVIQIRESYKKGLITYKELAYKFKVSPGCIGSIIRKQNWNWI